MDAMDVHPSRGELTGAHAEGEGRYRRRRPVRAGVTASCATFCRSTRPSPRYRHRSRHHVFPSELSGHTSGTPATRRVILTGLALGVCLGALGVGSALSMLAAVPVLLAEERPSRSTLAGLGDSVGGVECRASGVGRPDRGASPYPAPARTTVPRHLHARRRSEPASPHTHQQQVLRQRLRRIVGLAPLRFIAQLEI